MTDAKNLRVLHNTMIGEVSDDGRHNIFGDIVFEFHTLNGWLAELSPVYSCSSSTVYCTFVVNNG